MQIFSRKTYRKNLCPKNTRLITSKHLINIKYNDLINGYAEIDAFSQAKSPSIESKFSSRNMGKNDLWIAATAFITKSKLITADKDFEHLDRTFFDVIFINQPPH